MKHRRAVPLGFRPPGGCTSESYHWPGNWGVRVQRAVTRPATALSYLVSVHPMIIKHAQVTTSGYIEAGDVSSTYLTVLPLEEDANILLVASTLNQPVALLLPSEEGETGAVLIPAGVSFSIDFFANGMRLAKGPIKVKSVFDLPTSGLLTVSAFR